MTDTDKLNLILEHANEYFVNNREYHFEQGGFVSYEFSEINGEKIMYIADIFVSKGFRGGKTFPDLVHYCQMLAACEAADVAYASTEKSNPYLPSMKVMYDKVGFKVHRESPVKIWYRLDL